MTIWETRKHRKKTRWKERGETAFSISRYRTNKNSKIWQTSHPTTLMWGKFMTNIFQCYTWLLNCKLTHYWIHLLRCSVFKAHHQFCMLELVCVLNSMTVKCINSYKYFSGCCCLQHLTVTRLWEQQVIKKHKSVFKQSICVNFTNESLVLTDEIWKAVFMWRGTLNINSWTKGHDGNKENN